jgi:predicted nucleic acid-binding protein
VIAVSDASALITLSKIGYIHILPELYKSVYVTPEVYAEVAVTGEGLAGASEIAGAA